MIGFGTSGLKIRTACSRRVGDGGAAALLLTLLVLGITGGLSLFVALCWMLQTIHQGFETKATFDCVVVPGKRLQRGRITPEFRQRLSTALDLWRQRPVALYVSGGNCDGSGITEADAGADWLSEQGVEDGALVRESTASTSLENLLRVGAMLPPGSIPAIVSSPRHLPRLRLMAAEAGVAVVAVPSGTAGRCSALQLLSEAFYIHWYTVARFCRRCSRCGISGAGSAP